MKNHLRLMCVTGHPDDESLGLGPVLARYGSEGAALSVVCATRGERGWAPDKKDNPGLDALGRIREGELRAAARVLGVSEVHFLNYIDGDLDKANPVQAIAQVASHLRRFKPQVVITFDPFGAYGHPDHIAICQFTTAAIISAANSGERRENGMGEVPPHAVSKLYYMADTAEQIEPFEKIAGEIGIVVNGTRRRITVWPRWSISAVIDAPEQWQTVWQAIQCHETQKHEYELFANAPPEQLKLFCSRRSFFRVFSLVNGGPALETDLFQGLDGVQPGPPAA